MDTKAAQNDSPSFGAEFFNYGGSPDDPNEQAAPGRRTPQKSSGLNVLNVQLGRLRINGPFHKAGLRTSDIITSFRIFDDKGGYSHRNRLSTAELPSILNELSPEQEIVVFWRPAKFSLNGLSSYIAIVKLDMIPAEYELEKVPRTSIDTDKERVAYYKGKAYIPQRKPKESSQPVVVAELQKSFPEALDFAKQIVDKLDVLSGRTALTGNQSDSGGQIPESWSGLRIEDNILNDEIYAALLRWQNINVSFSGADLHPLLPVDIYLKPQEVAELVNEIMTYSYEKWFGMSARTITSRMDMGLFNPNENDIKLTFIGFGRPSFEDTRFLDSLIYMRDKGSYPAPEYALNTMSKSELASIADRSDFNTLPIFEQTKILRSILDNTTSENIENPEFQEMVLNFYENDFSELNNFAAWRSGSADDPTRGTWTGRFGPPTQDQALHMYMHMEATSLRGYYENYQEVANLFRNPNRTKVNFDVTYEKVKSTLSPQSLKVLDEGLKKYQNEPSYAYFFSWAYFNNRYKTLREEIYLKYLRELEWQRHVKLGEWVRT